MQKPLEYEMIRIQKVKRKYSNHNDDEIPLTDNLVLRGRNPSPQEFFSGENPLEVFWALERFRFLHKLNGTVLLQRCYRNSRGQVVWIEVEPIVLVNELDERKQNERVSKT